MEMNQTVTEIKSDFDGLLQLLPRGRRSRWICRVILYLNWGTQLAAATFAAASDVDRLFLLLSPSVDSTDSRRKKCQRNLRCSISVGAVFILSSPQVELAVSSIKGHLGKLTSLHKFLW